MNVSKLVAGAMMLGAMGLANATTKNGTCFYTSIIEPGASTTKVGNRVQINVKFITSRDFFNTAGCGTFDNVPVIIVDRSTGRQVAESQLIANNNPNQTYGGQWITPAITISTQGWATGSYDLVGYVGFNGWYHDTNPSPFQLHLTN